MINEICDYCGGELVLEKGGKVATRDGTCRIRRFRCTVCDIPKTIYAEGMIDDEVIPRLAVDEAREVLGQIEEDPEGYHCMHGYPINECIICN